MRVAAVIKKMIVTFNNLINKEKREKLAKEDKHTKNDNTLNESFEEEIEENLYNELVEARLALVLAMAPSCEQARLRILLGSSIELSVVSGCQQASAQEG